MCLICGNDYSENQVRSLKRQNELVYQKLREKDIAIDNLKKSLNDELLKRSRQVGEKDFDISNLRDEIEELTDQNEKLKRRCAENPVQYVKQPIEIQCPYCDYQEEIESTGDEPIKVAEVLSEHISKTHVPPEIIKPEVHSHCGSCFFNFANSEKIRAYQIEKDAEIQNLQTKIPLECLGEEGESIVVEGFIDGDYQIFKILKKHLNEIPVSVEAGLYYVYADGSKYYRSLIQDIKKHQSMKEPISSPPFRDHREGETKALSTNKIGSNAVSPTATPTEELTAKHPSPEENTIKQDDTRATKEQSKSKKKSRKEQIIDYLIKHPGGSSNQNVADALGLDKSNTSKILGKLLDQKKVSLKDHLYRWIGES